MGNKYYYLVASLPYLKFQKHPLISKEAFLDECAKWLSEKDKALLESVDFRKEKKETNELIGKWDEFDKGLKREIARFREAKKSGMPEKSLSDTARSIMAEENPFLVEERFEKTRWDFLLNEELKYSFDINTLIIYFLKLEIMERLSEFNKEKGEEKFYKYCEVFL